MKRFPMPHVADRRPFAAGAITLWIAISPWVWRFADSHSAVANHVSLVFAFGPLAFLIANLRAAAVFTLFGGAWLAISPWILGYATDHAAWLNDFVSGVLLIVPCASAAGVPFSPRGRARLAQRGTAAQAITKTAGSSG